MVCCFIMLVSVGDVLSSDEFLVRRRAFHQGIDSIFHDV